LQLTGLSKQTVATGFYLWGKEARSEDRAQKHAEMALGPAYLTAKLYDRAIPALKKALEKKPEDATTLFQLANAHFQLKQYDEALGLFERSIAGKGGSTKRTTDTWARILIGMIHDVKGDRKAAIASYEKAIETGADFAGSLKTAKQFLKKPFKPKPERKARRGKGKRKAKGRWRARRSKRNR
jgi:tetratricopeptide (TPR) repeat protein